MTVYKACGCAMVGLVALPAEGMVRSVLLTAQQKERVETLSRTGGMKTHTTLPGISGFSRLGA